MYELVNNGNQYTVHTVYSVLKTFTKKVTTVYNNTEAELFIETEYEEYYCFAIRIPFCCTQNNYF